MCRCQCLSGGAKGEPCADAKEPLPPCPFCGSHGAEVDTPCQQENAWWGHCEACGASTDIFDTEAEAEAAWRKREMKPESVTANGADGEAPHGAAANGGATRLWRDPAKELPDADLSVLVRLDNEEFEFAIAEFDGWRWTESGEPLTCAIRGWCHMDEAARILDAARKAVARG